MLALRTEASPQQHEASRTRRGQLDISTEQRGRGGAGWGRRGGGVKHGIQLSTNYSRGAGGEPRLQLLATPPPAAEHPGSGGRG